jgi:hypothetical protein
MLPISSGKADAARSAAQAASRPEQSKSDWVPSAQVVREFGISRRTLHRWLKNTILGFPDAIVVNHRLYFSRDELEAWKIAIAVKTGASD